MECVKVNLLRETGWILFSKFSDSHPELSKNQFAQEFERQYRCKIHKDVNLDTYYMEFTPQAWTWICLQYDVDNFDIIE
jgi:hypothetical protein